MPGVSVQAAGAAHVMSWRAPPWQTALLDRIDSAAASGPALPDLLRLIAQSVDADLIQVGIDMGTGYRRDCFIEQNLEIAGFAELSTPLFVVTRENRVQRSASPSGLIATPNRLDQRALPVGSAGRRSAPRSGIALLRSPSRPAFKASERRQFTLLLPHFNLSLALACELERTRVLERHARTALECARFGYVLLSRDGVPLHGNALAFDLFDRAQVALTPGLHLPDPALQTRFDAALRQPAAASTGPFCRLRIDGAPPLTLDLHRLPAVPERWTPTTPVFVVLLRQDNAAPPLDPEALKQFGLTPAELRLCCALADGMSLRACAEAWHRSYETLRSQLKTVLSKTGTHRQIELVALLERFRSR